MTTLKVQKRDMETKAKKLRREGFITGNLFGKEIEGSIPLKIERLEAERTLRGCMKGTQIMLDVEGKMYDVLIKEIDFDATKNQTLEIDFQALVSNEKVHSVAEIVLHNKEMVTEGVLEQLLEEVSYKATPDAIVSKVDIDCSKLKLGDSVKVGDLDMAKDKNVDIHTPLDTTIVRVIASHNDVADDEDEEASDEA